MDHKKPTAHPPGGIDSCLTEPYGWGGLGTPKEGPGRKRAAPTTISPSSTHAVMRYHGKGTPTDIRGKIKAPQQKIKIIFFLNPGLHSGRGVLVLGKKCCLAQPKNLKKGFDGNLGKSPTPKRREQEDSEWLRPDVEVRIHVLRRQGCRGTGATALVNSTTRQMCRS